MVTYWHFLDVTLCITVMNLIGGQLLYCFIFVIVCFKIALNNCLIHFNLGHCLISAHARI